MSTAAMFEDEELAVLACRVARLQRPLLACSESRAGDETEQCSAGPGSLAQRLRAGENT